MKKRYRHLKNVNLHLIVYSNEACLQQFRFLREEIKNVADLIDVSHGSTRISNYSCGKQTLLCIILCHLEAPCRWLYCEPAFGMGMLVPSEVFWKVIKHIKENWGHVLTSLRADIMTERVSTDQEGRYQGEGSVVSAKRQLHILKKYRNVQTRWHKFESMGIFLGACTIKFPDFSAIKTVEGLIFHKFCPKLADFTTLLCTDSVEWTTCQGMICLLMGLFIIFMELLTIRYVNVYRQNLIEDSKPQRNIF